MGADVSGCGFRSGGVALPVGEQGLGSFQPVAFAVSGDAAPQKFDGLRHDGADGVLMLEQQLRDPSARADLQAGYAHEHRHRDLRVDAEEGCDEAPGQARVVGIPCQLGQFLEQGQGDRTCLDQPRELREGQPRNPLFKAACELQEGFVVYAVTGSET